MMVSATTGHWLGLLKTTTRGDPIGCDQMEETAARSAAGRLTGAVTRYVDGVVAPAALGRAVLLGRAAAIVIAVAAGLLLVADPSPLVTVLVVAVLTAVAGPSPSRAVPTWYAIRCRSSRWTPLSCWPSWPSVGAAWPTSAVRQGASALAGVLIWMRALAAAALHAMTGYVVAAAVLDSSTVSPRPGCVRPHLSTPPCSSSSQPSTATPSPWAATPRSR